MQCWPFLRAARINCPSVTTFLLFRFYSIFDCVLCTNLAYRGPCEQELAQMITDRLNDIRQTAARIGVSPWTVRRLIDRGHVRSVNIGRRVLVSESEILRLIKNGTKRKS